MNRFRVRKTNNDRLVIQKAIVVRVPNETRWQRIKRRVLGGWPRWRARIEWHTVVELDRVWAANLAAELDAWLAGTDHIPDLETP